MMDPVKLRAFQTPNIIVYSFEESGSLELLRRSLVLQSVSKKVALIP
jgi:hypothetical protein